MHLKFKLSLSSSRVWSPAAASLKVWVKLFKMRSRFWGLI